MAGGLLLRDIARMLGGSRRLAEQWAAAINTRAPTSRFPPGQAHVDESPLAQGIVAGEAEGNERADELLSFGRQQHGSTAEEEKRAGVREKVQRRLLLNCAEILEAREARLKELQMSEDLAGPPEPAASSQKPWMRAAEAPTPYFRGVADARQRLEVLAAFSGGKQLGADLLDYFTCCRWEEAQDGKAKGGRG